MALKESLHSVRRGALVLARRIGKGQRDDLMVVLEDYVARSFRPQFVYPYATCFLNQSNK